MSPPSRSAPAVATVHYAPPPPNAHALSRPRSDAALLLADDGSDCESVAESSSPGPYSRRPTTSGFLGGGDCHEEDDGCSSCVEGGDLGGYQEAEDNDEEVSTASVFQPAVAREKVEDPERAAARQAEDRKFWEDCLGTGYP